MDNQRQQTRKQRRGARTMSSYVNITFFGGGFSEDKGYRVFKFETNDGLGFFYQNDEGTGRNSRALGEFIERVTESAHEEGYPRKLYGNFIEHTSDGCIILWFNNNLLRKQQEVQRQ